VEVPVKRSSYLDPYFRHPPIRFQMAGFPELGVRIEKIQGRDIPAVVGGNDQPLNIGDREIKIRILVRCLFLPSCEETVLFACVLSGRDILQSRSKNG
jgi:hypothetical protein